MTLEVLHPNFFGYQKAFVPSDSHADLLAFLEEVPVVATPDRDPANEFAFAAPPAGDVIVRGRMEASAGWPVWMGEQPGRGVDIPVPLAQLGALVGRELTEMMDVWSNTHVDPTDFSSVYVDRYRAGGSFVAHTDRTCYGPVVAGVSLGQGDCWITFSSGLTVEFTHKLEPGSLYVFAGILRDEPFRHQVSDVTGLRYGVTFRIPAAKAMDWTTT